MNQNIMKHFVVIISIVTSHAFAQSPGSGGSRELSADRPDTTESPITVEPGRVQIESGLYDWSRDDGDDTHTWLSLHTKFGLAESLDFGFVFESFVQEENPDAEGFGDIGLTMKWNLWGNDGDDTAFALIPSLTIPTHTSVSGGEWEGGLAAPLSMDLADGWGLGLMAEVCLVDDSTGSHQFEFLHTAVVGRDLSESLGMFLEYVGVASEEDYEASLASGMTYMHHDNLMLDISLRAGLNDAAPDVGMATGFTVRF